VCKDRTAVIIAAGTELTEGITQDTHVRFLGSTLKSLGFTVLRAVQLPDDAVLFREELSRATRDSCLVIVSGGLGPTTDDLSREVIAEAAGQPLEFHSEAWEALLARFSGRKVAESNRKQALAPRGFTLLANAHGTAPGFYGDVGAALVVALPGPPSELRPMFSQGVLPVLAQHFGGPAATEILWGTALMVPESNLEDGLRACQRAGITWGTRVDEDRIAFSLRGGSAEEREAVFEQLAAVIDTTRIRRGETRPAQLLTEALLRAGATLAAAESCTGGLIGKYMTDLPGSSRVFWGGTIAYSNEAKQRLLGVEEGVLAAHGAVSQETAIAMAEGVLSRSGAFAGIAVTGVAGPEGGTADKPVGTVWIAVAVRDKGCQARLFTFGGSRDMIRRRTAVAAMLFAEARVLGREFLDTRAKW
jgi:nicotinamide-nucleotide amidase